MRSEGEYQPRVGLEAVAGLESFAQVLIGITGPGRGMVHDREGDLGADACINHGLGGDIGKEIHVAEAGGARSQHLGNGEAGARAHEILAHETALGGPDPVL